MIIKYSSTFLQTLKKVDVRIRKSFKGKILIFSKNPNDLQLDNHLLKEPYQGLRSIDITADWRAIYEEKVEGEKIVAYFIILGTHKELFKSLNLTYSK
ncbi:MAG: type II toxin-antitoxin system mRNA interferase toxin, RelE/StbE family [Candidatus Daviesbacteria bacterium]|nr:type II toxin-antitoxin system mRNA interferase toxin, RelE/StbE family [Candidatus Daviesbacteria bacterium]